MKRIISGLACIAFFSACQDELYRNDLEENQAGQGVYFEGGSQQVFIQENKDLVLTDFNIKLVKPQSSPVSVDVFTGDQVQLDAYNKANGTNYILLPPQMYEITKKVSIRATDVLVNLPIKIKNIVFSDKGKYALPIKIQGGGVTTISGQESSVIVFEPIIATKAFRLGGIQASKGGIFPNDHTVAQWTLEVNINRNNYSSPNRSIAGTSSIDHPRSEIYTRFGDVTINHNQLQIKTGGSQMDIRNFNAEKGKWYALAFSYDGKTTRVYVNGKEVASQQIREGAYSVTGFWIGGSNELIREVRFWNKAIPQKNLEENMWKPIDPKSDGLILYYPLNGKKYDPETGKITEDETKIWDWSKTQGHIDIPVLGARYDDNGGNYFIFPPRQ